VKPTICSEGLRRKPLFNKSTRRLNITPRLNDPIGLEGEAIEGSILTSEAHHEVKRLELEELNLGEEAILLGKIA